MPGWETRLYLIEYAPGVMDVHHHPIVGLGYMLSGAMVSAYPNQPPAQYQAGESFFDLAEQPHTVSNPSDSEPMRILMAYTIRTGEPVTITP